MIPISARMSEVIRALRFPLIALVVLAHVPMAGDYARPLPDAWWTNAQGWYYYVTKAIAFTLAHARIPTFFLISGYFLFARPRAWWSKGVYSKEMNKRRRTLLYPYLIWCTIPLILWSIAGAVQARGIGAYLENILAHPWQELSYAYFFGPSNYPLYYIRDLLVLSLLAPVLDVVIRRVPWLMVGFFLLYFFGLGIPMIPSKGLFFFTLGGWLGSRHIDLAELGDHTRRWVLPLVAVATLAIPLAFGHPWVENLVCLYAPFGVLFFFSLGGWLHDHCPRWQRLSQRAEHSVFFVYVVHEIFILQLVKGFLYSRGWLETIPGFFIGGAVIYSISVAIYYTLRRWTPNLLHLLLGSRA